MKLESPKERRQEGQKKKKSNDWNFTKFSKNYNPPVSKSSMNIKKQAANYTKAISKWLNASDESSTRAAAVGNSNF